jgi:WD40 repeat protein
MAAARMNRLRSLVSSLCLSLVVGCVAVLGAGCGKSDNFDPEPLLVPWDQLSGRIAYVRGHNEIIVIDPAARNARRVYKTSEHDWVRDVTWHPSGNSLTVTLYNVYPHMIWSLASIDVQTGNKTDLYPAMNDPNYAAWSTDGRVAFKAFGPPFPGGLFIDGVPLSPGLDVAALTAPSWSPDGSTLAVVVNFPSAYWGMGDLNLVDVATGAASPLGPADCSEPRFSPDGTRIAYTFMPVATPSEQLRFVSAPGGVETHLSGADSIRPSHPAWSPDGSRLLVQSNTDLDHPKLFLVDATTGAPTQLTSKDGHLPAWTR